MYNNFDQSIKELTKVKELVKIMSKVALIHPNEIGLNKTIELIKKMADLSLPENESVCRALLTASKIIEECNLVPSWSQQQRLELALLLDSALPLEIPFRLVDGKCLNSLKYWMGSMLKFIEWNEQAPKWGTVEVQSVGNALQRFHRRLCCAIEMLNDNQNEINNTMASQLLHHLQDEINQMLERCKMAFDRQSAV